MRQTSLFSGQSPPAAGQIRGGGFAIEAEAGCAVNVGAEGKNPSRFERFEHLTAGMAITVAQAAGDNGTLGRNAGQKLRVR